MRRAVSIRLAIALMAFCLPLIPRSISAQGEKGKLETAATQQKPVAAYRIELAVREVDNGKRVNSRSYMMVVRESDWGQIRVGNRVPIVGGEKGFQYEDVGMSIDCRPRERDENLELDVRLESSSLAAPEQTPAAATNPNPVVRRQVSNVSAFLTPGKPTVVASMDDVLSNRRYEIEVTATKVK